MKSDKLQDAIGFVDSDLITRAEKSPAKKKKSNKIIWIAPIAAVLAIVICLNVILNNLPSTVEIIDTLPTGTNSNTQPTVIDTQYNNMAVALAEYPKMSPYPNSMFPDNSDSAYNAWRADIDKQREFCGAGNNLSPFIQKTFSEFLKDSKNENIIYSPLNVYMALSMLAEISDGNSRQQVLDLLNADSIETLRNQAHSIWNANYCDDGAVTSILASSLWMNKDVNYNKETLDLLASNYYTSTFKGEMGSEEYNKAFQSWLNSQTGGLLKDYISNEEMSPDTIMALATTIYFKANWDREFYDTETTKDTFHSPTGDVTIDFMNDTITNGTYYWGKNFSAINKSLDQSGSMWFILPDEDVNVDTLLTDAEVLSFITSNNQWSNQKTVNINLSIPKFDVSSGLDLKEGLKNLGVTDCFDIEKSDFSPLQDEQGCITEATHAARVAIDEKGVIAAAFTSMMEAGGAMPNADEVDFVADRPFIFVITGFDGLPLFIGIVNQP